MVVIVVPFEIHSDNLCILIFIFRPFILKVRLALTMFVIVLYLLTEASLLSYLVFIEHFIFPFNLLVYQLP